MNTAKKIAPFYNTEEEYLQADQKFFDDLVTKNKGAKEAPLDEVLKRVEGNAEFPV